MSFVFIFTFYCFFPSKRDYRQRADKRMLNKAIHSVGNACVKIYKIILWNVASVLWFKRLHDECVPLIVLYTCLYFNWTRRRLWFNLPWTFSSCNRTWNNKKQMLRVVCNLQSYLQRFKNVERHPGSVSFLVFCKLF